MLKRKNPVIASILCVFLGGFGILYFGFRLFVISTLSYLAAYILCRFMIPGFTFIDVALVTAIFFAIYSMFLALAQNSLVEDLEYDVYNYPTSEYISMIEQQKRDFYNYQGIIIFYLLISVYVVIGGIRNASYFFKINEMSKGVLSVIAIPLILYFMYWIATAALGLVIIPVLAGRTSKDKIISILNPKNNSNNTTAQKLNKLKQLKSQGILTDEEYERKRKDIIDNIEL